MLNEIGFDDIREEKSLISRYLFLKAQLDALTEELEEVKQEVMPALERNYGNIRYGDKSLTLAERTTYEYTEEIQNKEKLLRLEKKFEEVQGKAKVKSVTKYITVRASA